MARLGQERMQPMTTLLNIEPIYENTMEGLRHLENIIYDILTPEQERLIGRVKAIKAIYLREMAELEKPPAVKARLHVGGEIIQVCKDCLMRYTQGGAE
jgi:hypothetical protein